MARFLSSSVKTPTASWLPLPQLEVGNVEGKTITRAKLARRLGDTLGRAVVGDFDAAPAGTVRFATGTGTVVAAAFLISDAANNGILLHTRTQTSAGVRVDLFLFGSVDNLVGFQRADAMPAGWTSSAWYAIEELLESRGAVNTSQWDDEQSRSMEALKIALFQGSIGREHEHAGKPWTRGFTLGHTGPAQWLAEIYTDVVLDPVRWSLTGELVGTQRIMVGAPIWVRTTQLTRYSGRQRGDDRRLISRRARSV